MVTVGGEMTLSDLEIKFDDKYKLGFPLLADTEHKVAEAWGVWGEKSLYGRKFMGIVRSAFVVDEKGKLAGVFYKVSPKDTGWMVKDLPPGFTKVIEGYRTLRGKPAQVAHLVFSDGLVAVSVFIEPTPANPQPVGLSQQGGINVYSRQLDDHLVTVLGEAPGATVRQIAYSVIRR